jgi:hypothetical protein
MSRYKCIECEREETGETDCLKHTLKYGHKWFIDFESLTRDQVESGEVPLYCPLDDPDILDE